MSNMMESSGLVLLSARFLRLPENQDTEERCVTSPHRCPGPQSETRTSESSLPTCAEPCQPVERRMLQGSTETHEINQQ